MILSTRSLWVFPVHQPRALVSWRGSGWGIHVNPWLIHVNIWQKPLQHCKVISLQLIKINEKKPWISVTLIHTPSLNKWWFQSSLYKQHSPRSLTIATCLSRQGWKYCFSHRSWRLEPRELHMFYLAEIFPQTPDSDSQRTPFEMMRPQGTLATSTGWTQAQGYKI